MQPTKGELKAALIIERQQLLKLVDEASDEQLDQPSLCAGWSNRQVLGHIIGFELRPLDVLRLFLRLKPLNAINEMQAQHYAGCSKAAYLKLLRRGLRRTLFLLRIIPSGIFHKRFIPVPNGHISIGQLMGDMAMDRAVHYLDIAAPLGIASRITDEAVMNASLKFFLSCIDLLNPKIPEKFSGQTIKLQLSGLCAASYYWQIGTDQVSHVMGQNSRLALTAKGDTNDLLFTATGRSTLVRHLSRSVAIRSWSVLFAIH